MKSNSWKEVKTPSHEDRIWELYHENSKTSTYYRKIISDANQEEYAKTIFTSLPVSAKEIIHLPAKCKVSPGQFTFNELSALLYSIFSTVNDASNISSLELYIQIINVSNCKSGLYHCDPDRKELHYFDENLCESGKENDNDNKFSNASAVIYITAVFTRLTAVYGEIGYRKCLIEAGKMIQQICDSCNSLKVRCQEREYTLEREVEKYLGINGVDHSILSSLLIGKG